VLGSQNTKAYKSAVNLSITETEIICKFLFNRQTLLSLHSP